MDHHPAAFHEWTTVADAIRATTKRLEKSAALERYFPTLDDEFGPKPRSVYTYKELLEMFDATTKLHRHRVMQKMEARTLASLVRIYDRLNAAQEAPAS